MTPTICYIYIICLKKNIYIERERNHMTHMFVANYTEVWLGSTTLARPYHRSCTSDTGDLATKTTYFGQCFCSWTVISSQTNCHNVIYVSKRELYPGFFCFTCFLGDVTPSVAFRHLDNSGGATSDAQSLRRLRRSGNLRPANTDPTVKTVADHHATSETESSAEKVAEHSPCSQPFEESY